jgi:hypothetical protein
MTESQIRRGSGKSCRRQSAVFARSPVKDEAASSVNYQKRQLNLFAQFPPAALFAAIGRAARRSQQRRVAASGTALAMSRLWHAA